jgi:hypothetical protein
MLSQIDLSLGTVAWCGDEEQWEAGTFGSMSYLWREAWGEVRTRYWPTPDESASLACDSERQGKPDVCNAPRGIESNYGMRPQNVNIADSGRKGCRCYSSDETPRNYSTVDQNYNNELNGSRSLSNALSCTTTAGQAIEIIVVGQIEDGCR